MSTGMLELLAEDVKTIPYRPQFRKITDSVTAAILLQQMFYRWFHNKKQPFYKYKEACTADDYREGDSWCEELGFSRAEFDTALTKIGQKVMKGVEKDYEALVWYWTSVDRKTWYEVNEVAFRKATISLYGEKESSATKSDIPALDNLYTKNTSKKTTEKGADAQPTEQQEWFKVVCAIVAWDSKVLGAKEKAQVAQTIGILKNAGYTLEEAKSFLEKVWMKDWRYKKDGQMPTLTQLRTEIGKLRTAAPIIAKETSAYASFG